MRYENILLASQVVAADEPVERIKIGIHIVPRAREALARVKDDMGLPHQETVARLVEWFSEQDPKFQDAIVRRNPDAKREFARLALQQMVGLAETGRDATTGLDVEQATAGAHALIDRLARLAEERGRLLAKAIEGGQPSKRPAKEK